MGSTIDPPFSCHSFTKLKCQTELPNLFHIIWGLVHKKYQSTQKKLLVNYVESIR